jgi:hypothetical protein
MPPFSEGTADEVKGSGMRPPSGVPAVAGMIHSGDTNEQSNSRGK